MKTYSGHISKLNPNQIFVFGSNIQGRHGKGAALTALKFGAKYGIAEGFSGQTYAIITKDLQALRHPSWPKESIINQITWLYDYAKNTFPELEYLIAYSGIGVNLNGYTAREMAEMFYLAGPIPDNIIFEEQFKKLINDIRSI